MAENNFALGSELLHKNGKHKVHKFGGTCLATAESINAVADIITSQVQPGDLVVVSANGNVTNWLLALTEGGLADGRVLIDYFESLQQDLQFDGKVLDSIKADIVSICTTIGKPHYSQSEILSHGEVWSSLILSDVLNRIGHKSLAVDSCRCLKLNTDTYQYPFDQSFADNALAELYQSEIDAVFIVTGFIALDRELRKTTLGRNGSDFSATALGYLINAPSITIWTDVNGIYTADPKIIKQPLLVESLTLCEAQALSELGSNVLHEKTVLPLLSYKGQVRIKSFELPHKKGTVVSQDISSTNRVKTITFKPKLHKVCVHSIDELQARRIQKKIAEKNIASYVNGYDITQHKLTFYIEKSDVFSVTSTIKALQHYPSVLLSNMTLISLVGQNIRQDKRIIERFIRRLSSFDTQEIHYPNNSHSLSVVIEDDQAESLLHDLHTSFFHREPTVPIVVLGYGNIGKKFIELMDQGYERLGNELNRTIQLLAVANSKRFIYEQNGLELKSIEAELAKGNDNSSEQVFDWLEQYSGREIIIVDTTASQTVSGRYQSFANNKWHIISANKIAASDKAYAREVQREINANHRVWKKNTTAGAGLPIQAVIKNLLESGDRIQKLSGIFSGSLSWLFSEYDGSEPFTKLLKVAQDNAFTEPDPREDLSGNDVIRKIRILAQQLGFDDAPEEFEAAISGDLLQGAIDDFWSHYRDINTFYQQLLNKAESKGRVIRYIATLTPQKLSLKLEFIESNHPFASLNPCDNIFQVESDWYKDNPLIIQGPGAGREVTAGGVLNDLCDLLRGQ
ncbi:bifunctional aspartate kinase/homoserine dehydrogenase II [Kangiella sediminilitoris]|uniref:Aspartate kinase n=1 Tax=Kangiella sediminilitoris TaxID=1144748 RepID=A0A1B3BB83_9GAMM|nr:bifunctional aspartate kinase/homoserine dehydrogenase II [Kangiella sediminilitoris]AOE50052.1 Aspartate kinase [Kangiella sediminilitoris]